MNCPLFMSDQDVAEICFYKFVIEVNDGSTRIAEDGIDTLFL
jgi:hypothetical protein